MESSRRTDRAIHLVSARSRKWNFQSAPSFDPIGKKFSLQHVDPLSSGSIDGQCAQRKLEHQKLHKFAFTNFTMKLCEGCAVNFLLIRASLFTVSQRTLRGGLPYPSLGSNTPCPALCLPPSLLTKRSVRPATSSLLLRFFRILLCRHFGRSCARPKKASIDFK